MSINVAKTVTHLTRANLWQAQIKEVLQDVLDAQGYVRWLTDFPEGTTLNIPSIGEATVRDFTDDTAVVYDSLDTGNFTFTITEYKQSGLYITQQARQDSFYSSVLESGFVPKMTRALGENVETDILGLATAGGGIGTAGQTVSVVNAINGADHRIVASGGADTTRTFAIADFAKALYGLKKANVPQSALVAIVDPGVEYELNTLTNIVNVSNNPMWEGVITTGIAQDMRFVKNIFGWDIFASNYLGLCGANGGGAAETITDSASNARSTAANATVNVFFSAASPDLIPFIGAWRQTPTVDSEFNKDKQREEYVLTARYGLKLYRQENLITVLSDTVID